MTHAPHNPFVALPASVMEAALDVHDLMRRQGIPYALVGGIAVSAYANPRATMDVDVIVASNRTATSFPGKPLAVVEGRTFQRHDVDIDVMGPPPGMRSAIVESAIAMSPTVAGVVVLYGPALVGTKLIAGRMKDQADVVEMVKAGTINVAATQRWLARNMGQEFAEDFESLALQAQWESSGRRNPRRTR